MNAIHLKIERMLVKSTFTGSTNPLEYSTHVAAQTSYRKQSLLNPQGQWFHGRTRTMVFFLFAHLNLTQVNISSLWTYSSQGSRHVHEVISVYTFDVCTYVQCFHKCMLSMWNIYNLMYHKCTAERMRLQLSTAIFWLISKIYRHSGCTCGLA